MFGRSLPTPNGKYESQNFPWIRWSTECETMVQAASHPLQPLKMIPQMCKLNLTLETDTKTKTRNFIIHKIFQRSAWNKCELRKLTKLILGTLPRNSAVCVFSEHSSDKFFTFQLNTYDICSRDHEIATCTLLRCHC